jgi:hypothetical protein
MVIVKTPFVTIRNRAKKSKPEVFGIEGKKCSLTISQRTNKSHVHPSPTCRKRGMMIFYTPSFAPVS